MNEKTKVLGRPKGDVDGPTLLLELWSIMSDSQKTTSLPQGAILRIAAVLGVRHQYISRINREGLRLSQKTAEAYKQKVKQSKQG